VSDLFTQPQEPDPRWCCPACGRALADVPLRVKKKAAQTSKDALASAQLRAGTRKHAAIELLKERGWHGATDDEMDTIMGWAHQCTTPVMNALRKEGRIAWALDRLPSGQRFKVQRLTRKDNDANVNVLASELKHGKHDDRHGKGIYLRLVIDPKTKKLVHFWDMAPTPNYNGPDTRPDWKGD